MNGGSITGNQSETGGGVFVDDFSEISMSGGSITGNTAVQWGNDVEIYYGAPGNTTLNLSGNAQIGNLALYPWNNSKPTITVTGSFVGSVSSLDLAGAQVFG